jgi:hypothetical protein
MKGMKERRRRERNLLGKDLSNGKRKRRKEREKKKKT